MDKINSENMIAIEQPFLKIVVENLKKNVRSAQKLIEKDMSSAQTLLDKLISAKHSPSRQPSPEKMDVDTDHRLELLNQLKSLRSKLVEKKAEEKQLVLRLAQRSEHVQKVQQFSVYSQPEYLEWSNNRMNRLLMDYMIRMGYQDSAKALASRHNLHNFADFSFFSRIISIENSLLVQNSCSDCLMWCSENKANLKKSAIHLEFELRLQEFIELCRSRKVHDAICYAKKHFKDTTPAQNAKYNQAMPLLVIEPSTTCKRYLPLYSLDRWKDLVLMFRSAAYTLIGLPSQPLIYPLIETGISALKTHSCTSTNIEDINKNCPICNSNALKSIAEHLPHSYHTNSHLVCRISGLKMDEDNPPMRLPNGYVYSFLALQDMACQNDSIVVCPRTGDSFAFADCKKLFIV